jgi:hypothetical protein
LESYQSRELISDPGKLGSLWDFYQKDYSEELLKASEDLEAQYPYLKAAVLAHLARFPEGGSSGRPSRVLTQIIKELGTDDFAAVFKEFNRRELIYGFGDWQVKRLFDGLANSE